MDRKAYLKTVMCIAYDRHSELVRQYKNIQEFRLLSKLEHRFWEDMIELNKKLADNAEDLLYKEYGIRSTK